LENIHSTEKILEQKKTLLPELKQAQQEAVDRFNEAKKARDQKTRIEQLKKEKAWAFVYGKEAELGALVEEAAKQGRRIPKIEEQLKGMKVGILSRGSLYFNWFIRAQDQMEAANEKIAENEALIAAMGSVDELQEKYAKLRESGRGFKAKIMNTNVP